MPYAHKVFSLCILMLYLLGSLCCTSKKRDRNPKIPSILNKISADTIESNIRRLAAFHTRHTTSDTASDSTGIGAARRWIYHSLKRYSNESGGRLKVWYDQYVEKHNRRIDQPVKVVNVVAKLPGVQKQSRGRIYVVSGHYDSRVSDIMDDSSYAPGADDDASGTAAVMELARVMSQYKFDATLIFMTVAGEEQGLLGSSHFAEMARKQNLNIAGMFTNDIIGNSVKQEDGSIHDDEVRVFAEGIPPQKELSPYHRRLLYTGGENDTPSRQLARVIHEAGARYLPNFEVNMIYRKDRYLRGGDHSPFLKNGYPAVRFTEPHENFHHQHQDVRKENGNQYGDLPKFVDFEYAAKVARLNAASLATLAYAPASPTGVSVEVKQLDNSTTLHWKANDEPDLRGYEIVWRKTIEPFWQYSKFVGDTTRFTIPGASKDNYIFGVRAVDSAGYQSPAVYPLPSRN